jgi:hypothetical protein
MDKKWVVMLIILFATVAGAALVISYALSPRYNPYAQDYESCAQIGGSKTEVGDRKLCTISGENFYE